MVFTLHIIIINQILFFVQFTYVQLTFDLFIIFRFLCCFFFFCFVLLSIRFSVFNTCWLKRYILIINSTIYTGNFVDPVIAIGFFSSISFSFDSNNDNNNNNKYQFIHHVCSIASCSFFYHTDNFYNEPTDLFIALSTSEYLLILVATDQSLLKKSPIEMISLQIFSRVTFI